MAGKLNGVINSLEAYSKQEVLSRLGISQRFWDEMLDNGLPFANIGHGRWVLGQDLLDYMHRNSEVKVVKRDDDTCLKRKEDYGPPT